jgi:hypothetical protein
VTGASGAGKSSLLRAGLLPALARGLQLPEAASWPCRVLTPTGHPLTELAAQLAALGGADPVSLRRELAQHPAEAHLAVRAAVLADVARRAGRHQPPGDGDERLVLILDQFEQVFTLNQGGGAEAERLAFLTAVCAAATSPTGPDLRPPALVVVAVRGDFWDRCAAYPVLAGALGNAHLVVEAMSESDLRLAITGPADAAGLRIDLALTDAILSDLRATSGDNAAGALPLLSQAMLSTWNNREGDRLTSHGYARAGGVSHAVQNSADEVYDALPAGQQMLAREILRAMTVTSRDGRLTRRPVTRADLYAGRQQADRARVDAVLEAFASRRLIVLDRDTAQIAHDALLSAWPRLRGWLGDDTASWILHGQLADDAAAWHDSSNDPSFLYRGTQLAALRQAATRWSSTPDRYPALTTAQRDFLEASDHAVARAARLRRGAVAVLAVLALLASTATAVAFQQRSTAQAQRDDAIFNQITAEAGQLDGTNLPVAAQLDLVAYRMRPDESTYTRLISDQVDPLAASLGSHPGSAGPAAMAVAIGGHGHMLASGYANGTVRLWNIGHFADPAPIGRPFAGHWGQIEAVALSPDGRLLILAGLGGLWMWNIARPLHPVSLWLRDAGQHAFDRSPSTRMVTSWRPAMGVATPGR